MSTSLSPLVASRRGAGMLLLLGLLAGCGRKGDLYMPDAEQERPRSGQPGAPEAEPSGPAETETLPDLEED